MRAGAVRMRRCYERGLTGRYPPDTAGRAVMRFVIDTAGRATEVELVRALSDPRIVRVPEFVGCLERAVAQLDFGAGQRREIDFPVIFRPAP